MQTRPGSKTLGSIGGFKDNTTSPVQGNTLTAGVHHTKLLHFMLQAFFKEPVLEVRKAHFK
jgi:hypothetical protein